MITFNVLNTINSQRQNNTSYTSRPVLKINNGLKHDTVNFSGGMEELGKAERLLRRKFITRSRRLLSKGNPAGNTARDCMEMAAKYITMAESLLNGTFTGQVKVGDLVQEFEKGQHIKTTILYKSKDIASEVLNIDPKTRKITQKSFYSPEGVIQKKIDFVNQNTHYATIHDDEGKPYMTATIVDKNKIYLGRIADLTLHNENRSITDPKEIDEFLNPRKMFAPKLAKIKYMSPTEYSATSYYKDTPAITALISNKTSDSKEGEITELFIHETKERIIDSDRINYFLDPRQIFSDSAAAIYTMV